MIKKSTWQDPPAADEIARQQAVKEQLTPGLHVTIRGLGEFIYSGLWDTMHCFYPTAGNENFTANLTASQFRYLKRDLRGRYFLQLPYTLLADLILQF